MTLHLALTALLLPSSLAGQTPARVVVIAAATDIIEQAHYCTFISIDAAGQPQARMVDPIAPGADFTIWFATNPLTRKVGQVRRNPKVTMSCFDAATASYVAVLGRGDVVTDAAEKQRHWKPDWAAIYPNGATSNDVMLIRITPARLEIVSESRGVLGDPKTWLPVAIDFPENQPQLPRAPDGMVIAAAKAVSVRKLDPSQTDTAFIDWLDSLVGARAPRRWEVNDCGESPGSPQPDRDLPFCAEVDVSLSGGRHLKVAIGVGTVKRGLSVDSPGMYYAVVSEANGSMKSVHHLSELPTVIRGPQ